MWTSTLKKVAVGYLQVQQNVNLVGDNAATIQMFLEATFQIAFLLSMMARVEG